MSFLRRFRPVPAPEGEAAIRMPSLQIARLMALWERGRRFAHVFRQSGLGMAGLIIMIIFTGMAVSAPLLTSVGLLRSPDANLC
ncbi:MAG: hypothetical protein ACREDF_04465, partial [Thermoplasmata archaeon]